MSEAKQSVDRIVRIAEVLKERGHIDDVLGASLRIYCNDQSRWNWIFSIPGQMPLDGATLSELCDAIEREYRISQSESEARDDE